MGIKQLLLSGAVVHLTNTFGVWVVVQSQDIHLYVNSGGDIYFAWGAGSPNAAEKLIGQVSIGEWVSVYVGCAGLRPFPNTDANQTNLNKNFDFRVANANFIANDLDASQLITPPETMGRYRCYYVCRT